MERSAANDFVQANREGFGDKGIDTTLRDAAADQEPLAPHVAQWDRRLRHVLPVIVQAPDGAPESVPPQGGIA